MLKERFSKVFGSCLVVGFIVLGGLLNPSGSPVEAASKVTDPLLKRGLALYQKHCVACHGETGRGDGEAEYLLWPKPRNFSSGNFRLTSTESGMPTEADIVNTLRMGMAGSSMPSWGHFPDADLKALAVTVRYLALEAKISDLMTEDSDLSCVEALEIAESVFKPGPPVEIPAEIEPTPARMAEGKKLYKASCAKCHDADGRGNSKEDMKTDEGELIFARDFTLGIFKGGSAGIDLARRIKRGMPGTPMPGSTEYTGDQLWAIVQYVQHFIKPNAQERVIQKQLTFDAKRVEGEIITNPMHPAWSRYQARFVPVMPLWWRNERIEGCELQAAHDGKRLAIRLVWDDPRPDENPLKQHGFTDGAAIQFSPSADPPIFAMGAKNDEVAIWHWKASWEKDPNRDSTDMRTLHPNMPFEPHNFGAPDEAVYQTGEHAGNPLSQRHHKSSVENLRAAGFGTLTNHGAAAQNIEGRACWANGKWHVLFVGNLKDDLKATPGRPISLALAVWDGSASDRNGQKSVTIWHKLVVEK